MQLRHFVSGSSVVLLGWLAVTFVHQVPSQRYRKLDKYPTTAAALVTPAAGSAAEETPALPVSVSR